MAAVALVAVRGRLRAAVLAAALGLLLLAPASWAVQTLGHSTTGTFPAGGPAQSASGGRGGPGGGFGAPRRGGSRARPAAARRRDDGGRRPAPATAGGRFGGGAPGGGMGAGGPFGGDNAGLSQAVAYAKQHGGGAIAVSSQSGAAASIIRVGRERRRHRRLLRPREPGHHGVAARMPFAAGACAGC